MAHVLVVEDDSIVAKAITTCLRLDQHEVRTASDLPNALELLQREPPDLILTSLLADTFSPAAFDALATIRQAAPATPIVLATAHPQAARSDPARYGLSAIILKPFSPSDLRAVVQGALAAQRQ